MSPHYNSHIEAETAMASFESKDIAERKNSFSEMIQLAIRNLK